MKLGGKGGCKQNWKGKNWKVDLIKMHIYKLYLCLCVYILETGHISQST